MKRVRGRQNQTSRLGEAYGLVAVALLWALLCGCAHDATPIKATAAPPPAPPVVVTVDFATQVKPILENYCYQCHGNGRTRAGVRLDVKADAMRHITPGDPMHSDVYRAITRSMGASDHMPPISQEQPKAADVATIKLWIEQGARWAP
jgi:uncharacterized membrane protein